MRIKKKVLFIYLFYYKFIHKYQDKLLMLKTKYRFTFKAVEEHGLCLKDCIFIGDTGSTDMIAAERANMKKIVVRTGFGESRLTKQRNS